MALRIGIWGLSLDLCFVLRVTCWSYGLVISGCYFCAANVFTEVTLCYVAVDRRMNRMNE